MPEFQLQGKENFDFQRCDSFTQGYIEAMFFTASEPELEDKGVVDLSPEAWDSILKDCGDFQKTNDAALLRACNTAGYGYTEAGRDFWFSRRGEGVGFWDRDLGDIGDILHAAAKNSGNIDLYLGDNGWLYL